MPLPLYWDWREVQTWDVLGAGRSQLPIEADHFSFMFLMTTRSSGNELTKCHCNRRDILLKEIWFYVNSLFRSELEEWEIVRSASTLFYWLVMGILLNKCLSITSDIYRHISCYLPVIWVLRIYVYYKTHKGVIQKKCKFPAVGFE